MKSLTSLISVVLAAQLISAAPVLAQTDCIENAEGSLLCGKDAEAEKERIRSAMLERQGARADESQSASAPAARRGSVYNSYSRRAFVRGGTAFSGGGADFGDNFAGAAGVGFDLGNKGLSVETEVLVLRDSETFVDPFFGTITAKALGIAGLVSLRYDVDTDFGFNPFASVGVGPGYLRASLDDGVTSISDDDFTFTYTGRAGVTVDFSERFGVEAAYRFLDTSQNGFAAQHLVELGLNLGF